MAETYQQNAVSSAVWRWTNPPGSSAKTESAAKFFLKVGLQIAVMLAAAAVIGLHFGHKAAGLGLVVLAAYVLVTALFVRRAYDAFQRGVGMVARGVGVALTWILLVPFFYLTFVPGRAIMTLKGKDPLTRKFPSDEPTYWVAREPEEKPDHYRKQFR